MTSKNRYVLPLRIQQLDDGRYLARSPRLPGLNVEGDSIDEVVRLAPKVARADRGDAGERRFTAKGPGHSQVALDR